MIRPPSPKIYVPLLMILAVEILFRLGVWEKMVLPNSHTGKSIEVREAILQIPEQVNFVTLGSSIPEGGLDHKKIYALGKEFGFTHVNLSMPGSHLMTIRELTQWLPKYLPNLYGVVIGLSFRNLFYAFNGYYEIKIISPFKTIGDEYWIARQVPFQSNKLESYGIFSNLILSREDIRDFLIDPIKRYQALAVRENNSIGIITRSITNNNDNICSIDRSNYDNCIESLNAKKINKKLNTHLIVIESQCIKFRNELDSELNIESTLRQPLSNERLFVKDTWQLTLKESKFILPPIVILMPTTEIASLSKSDQAKYNWAINILKPLAESGDIILEDLTFLFHNDNECDYFQDLVHLNIKGQNKVMETITPRLKNYFIRMQNNRPPQKNLNK